MSRSLAREVAMKLAYSRLLGGEDTPAAVLEKSGEAEPLSVEDAAFAEALAAGVADEKIYVDPDFGFAKISLTSPCSTTTPPSRMATL